MAVTINFYQLSKRENSTRRPSGAPQASYSCLIKDGSGVRNPEIRLTIGDVNPAGLNYAHIPIYNRYYYVGDWTYTRGEWSTTLTCDELATWRQQIGAASLYVLRAAYRHNGLVPDGMYPIINGITVNDQPYMLNDAIEHWWNPYQSAGIGITAKDGGFVVGVLSYVDANTSTFGGINYLWLTPGQMQSFLRAIYDPDGNPQAANAIQAVFRQQMTADEIANLSYVVENPFTDYIKSVMYIPASPANKTLQTSFYFGHNLFTQADNQVSSYSFDPTQIITLTAGFDIPQHPEAGNRGRYLNARPYTDSYLLLPRLGVVELDNSLFASSTMRLRLDLQIDPISGMGVYVLYASHQEPDGVARQIEIQRWSAKIGVNVALSETKEVGETLNALMSLVNPASAIASMDIAGAITGAGAAITSLQRASETGGGTIGTNDGWLGLMQQYRTPHLLTIWHNVADDDNANNGRPLCEVAQLSTLPGYIKVQDGDVSIPGYSGEQEAVRAYLEGGFYYE